MTTQLAPDVSLTFTQMTELLAAHAKLGNDAGSDELANAFCGDPFDAARLKVELQEIAAMPDTVARLARAVLDALT